ncbi:S1 RNA-binding domain-containing protein [Streptococcus pneumoniae]|nr:S1 RNA-binding domain-containing protein [Streptococcus pneumoniae]
MDLSLILFENLFKPRQRRLAVGMVTDFGSSIQTSKQYFEQSTASFLVCSLIFIEYKSAPGHILHSNSLLKMDTKRCKGYQKGV